MSKLEVDAIEPQSGTTLTLGASGDAVALGSGASVSGLTLSDNILFNAASKGIYLGVTSATASNLLDDYEEGTWTPVFADAASGGNTGTIGSTTSATYTKVGNMVQLDCYVGGLNTSGMTAGNPIYIRNLPFTSSGYSTASFYTYRVGRDAATVSSCIQMSNSTTSLIFRLFTTNSATTDKNMLVSNIVSGTSEIIFSIVYKTT